MILGVDHLALNVNHTDNARKLLEADGFVCAFLEYDVPNDPAKIPLLTHYKSTHDLGVFRPAHKGISLEITNHGNVVDHDSPYFYYRDYIELKTRDLEAEKQFWKHVFHFSEQDKNTLQFSSPLPQWSCKIKLIEKAFYPNYMLDGKGYACLAFLTNSLKHDMKVAESAGALEMITPFQSFVNGRYLNIVMFRTPGGAICELIEIEKVTKK